jgi:hypothetical protein
VKHSVVRVVGIAAGAVFVLFLLAGCGSSTPDTEGQTLTQARQTLRDAGVPEENITVTGETGNPDSLIVCNHSPAGAEPSEPVTLEVATNCPQAEEEDDDDRKRKKRSGGGGRRR